MTNESMPFFDRVFRHLGESGWEDWTAKLLALVIVGLAVEVSRRLWTRYRPLAIQIWSSSRSLDRAHRAVAPDSRGLWLAPSIAIAHPDRYKSSITNSKPIIVVANLKGGVGKTTVAANLIAHYANKKQKRVLGIDLDFQGSLTACALSQANRDQLLSVQAEGGLSKAAHLINDRDAFWLQQSADPVENVPTAKIVSAYYSLAAMENRVMVEWLTAKRRRTFATILPGCCTMILFNRHLTASSSMRHPG